MNLTLSNESRMELGLPERSGMALLIVLALIVMVALSAYGFTLLMQSQYRLSRVHEDQVQAKLAALSGVDLVAALLKLPPASRGELGDVTNNPELFQAIAVEEVARNSTGNSLLLEIQCDFSRFGSWRRDPALVCKKAPFHRI